MLNELSDPGKHMNFREKVEFRGIERGLNIYLDPK